MRRRELAPRTSAILAIVASLAVCFAVADANGLGPLPASLLLAASLVALGVAAAERNTWRVVAPVGGAVGLVVLALMAWGPLHPPVFPHDRSPPPPPLALRAWPTLLAGALLLLVPRRWALAAATALLWTELVVAAINDARTIELRRVYFMAGPAFLALAALLSASVPHRAPRRTDVVGPAEEPS